MGGQYSGSVTLREVERSSTWIDREVKRHRQPGTVVTSDAGDLPRRKRRARKVRPA